MLLPRRTRIRHLRRLPYILAIPISALLINHQLLVRTLFLDLLLRLVVLRSDPQSIHRAQQRTVQIRLVGVDIPVKTRVDEPFDKVESLVEARRQLVFDRVVEVVAEDEVVAADVVLRGEVEGQGVQVCGVRRVREVRGGFGGAGGQAAVVLDAGGDVGAAERAVDVCRLLGVDGDLLLVGVVGAGGDVEDVFVGHGCGWLVGRDGGCLVFLVGLVLGVVVLSLSGTQHSHDGWTFGGIRVILGEIARRSTRMQGLF